MSITTYDELKTAVARWLKRDDLTAYIPDYIAFGERRLWYGDNGRFPSPPVRIGQNRTTDTGSIVAGVIQPSQFAAYPFLQASYLYVTSGGVSWPLRYLAPHQFAEYATDTGSPIYYTEGTGGNAQGLRVAPLGSGTYTLEYYYRPISLSASYTDTLLLQYHPELYLYAACIEGCVDIQNDSAAARFADALSGKLRALHAADHNQAAGGSLAVTVAR